MSELPAWLIEELQDARQLLGVGDEWHIVATVVDHPNGDENNDGMCCPDATYLNARMEFSRDLAQDANGRFVVLHEMLHVTHAEVDQVVDTALGGLSEGERGRMRELYEAAVERSLQRMSRAMARHIRPVGAEAVLHAKGDSGLPGGLDGGANSTGSFEGKL